MLAGVTNINSYTQLVEWTFGTDPANGGFKIFRSNGGAFELIDTAPAADRSYYSTGLISETEYAYKILPHNTVSEADFSNEVSETTGEADPVLWLRFEEASGTTLADSSGNELTGTIVGANPGVNCVFSEPGAIANDPSKKGFYAYGETCHVDVGNPALLQIVGPITIRAFVKPNSWPAFGHPYAVVVAKGYDGLSEGWFLRFFYDAGTIKLQFGSYNGTTYMVSWDVTGWSLADYKMVSAIYNGTDLKLCINGVEVASEPSDLGAALSNSNVCVFGEYLAADDGSFGRYGDFTLDELYVFAAALPVERELAYYQSTL